MLLPNEIRRSFVREEFLGGIEHGADGEELRVCILRFRSGEGGRVELRQWQADAGSQKRPTRHGVIIPVSIVPWIIEMLSKIKPAESIDDRIKNLKKENSK